MNKNLEIALCLVMPTIIVLTIFGSVLGFRKVAEKRKYPKPTPREMQDHPFLVFIHLPPRKPESDDPDAVILVGRYADIYLDAVDGIETEWKARQARQES